MSPRLRVLLTCKPLGKDNRHCDHKFDKLFQVSQLAISGLHDRLAGHLNKSKLIGLGKGFSIRTNRFIMLVSLTCRGQVDLLHISKKNYSSGFSTNPVASLG